MSSIHRMLPASLLAVLLIQTPAYAASATAPGSTKAKAQPKRQIEEVTVTAERRQSSVQDTSISISAFTSSTLKEFGIRNQSDLQNMVPATVILPYDAAIRGVGRNFRNLGGDPGVATYIDNVYSEDLYTATIGSMWDLKRVEILRGPQGTLYGRNAIGGAMNFIYKRPTDEFEAAIKGIAGNNKLADSYLAVSGPLIHGKLDGRLTMSDRTHDGYVKERGKPLAPNLDSGDEANVALQLLWTPTDNISVNLRSNYAKVDRVMGGADGGGLVMFYGSAYGGKSRDYTHYALGYRAVNAAETDPTQRDYLDPSMPTYTFTNPQNGQQVEAQNLRAGVDVQEDYTGSPSTGLPNYSYGLTGNPSQCVFYDRNDIKGSNVCAMTNGLNNETFDQQGNQLNFEWDVKPGLTIKYIYGLNRLLYRRITDDDKNYNTTMDRQFYVNHEAEYESHELQAFWNPTDSLTFTSGVFFYHAVIDQRGDFFSSVKQSEFVNGDPTSMYLESLGAIGPMVDLYTAKDQNPDAPPYTIEAAVGAWSGDKGAPGHNVMHGPNTQGTDLLYGTNTNRRSFAFYTQGVWNINDKFALTVGARFGRDRLYGEENVFEFTEGYVPAQALGMSLAQLNVLRGALDPTTLQPTGNNFVLVSGIPLSLSVYRYMRRVDTKWTYRLNLDYNESDNVRWYASVTTGYRAGGFNLVFFSQTPTFDPEELVSYEIGYKARLLDNTLQVDASAYVYNYMRIQTFGAQTSAVAGTTVSVLDAPGARITGLEGDITWLASENWTLGGNFSLTPSRYTHDFYQSDTDDPKVPYSLFDALNIKYNLKGNELLNVPHYKGTFYASYMLPLSIGSLELLGDYSWISEVYNTPFQKELDAAPAYSRFDLRATLTSNDSRWVASLYVNNVLNKLGIRQVETSGEYSGYIRTGQVTEPRQIGLELTYKMGGYQ